MMAADTAMIQDFKAMLRGALIGPEDDSYDAARKVYNAMIDKRPAMIVRCAGTADVIAAVNFARTHDLPLAVRAGGHSVAGNSTCDAGLVIDLSPMKGIRVDPVQRTARAEGGVTWGDFDHETQVFGLATTGGIASTTGIAGLTLGGGIGYLNRKYGLACDNLLSADVVTADGRLLTASSTDNPDLFWALRGGGGNFGVVTSFEYRIHPVGPVLAGLLVWPLVQAKDVLRFYRDFSIAAPDELRLDATLTTTPVGPGLAVIVCWCGSIEEGERMVRPLREFGPPVVDTVAAVPYKTIQTLLESLGYLPGLYHYWKSSFIKELSEEAIATLVDTFTPAPAPLCAVALEHLGGAVARVGDTDTAFHHRQAQHSCLVLAAWTEPAESEQNMTWARKVAEATKPFLDDAVYVNYLGEGEGENRVRAAYGANYERLVAIKQKYDSANLFRLNQNIQPTT
jgi:FAD/FMN-containing dehydrogenase